MIRYKYKNEKDYFALFSNVVVVKGAQRNLLIDLHKNNYIEISLNIAALLENIEKSKLSGLLKRFPPEIKTSIIELLNNLACRSLGFFTNNPKVFKKLDFSFNWPTIVSNAVVDMDGSPEVTFMKNIISQLNEVGCSSVQLRFFYPVEIQTLLNVLKPFVSSRIQSISIVAEYSSKINYNESMVRVIRQNLRITHCCFYNYPYECKSLVINDVKVDFLKNNINRVLSCGNIHKENFNGSLLFFTEAQHHNTCLNRKISIDT